MDSLFTNKLVAVKAEQRVTYVLSRLPHFFYHDSIITALCERGIHVELLFIKRAQIGKDDQEELKQGVMERVDTLADFQKRFPNLTVVEIDKEQRSVSDFCTNLRFIRSYASYLQRISRDNYYLKRWFSWMPEKAQRLCSMPFLQELLKLPFIIGLMEKIDLCIPANKNIVRYLSIHKPDWVVVSPANTRTISDAEWIKAAKKLGIKNAVVILSWDNLTTKGLIHIRPDYVFAWNKIQARDAVEIHHIDKKRARIVGSPFFDKWRDVDCLIQPRAESMRSQGLNPDFPYIVYLGSSGNIAEDETWLIRELVSALKNSGNKQLENLQVLVRPHSSSQETLKSLAGLPVVLTDSAFVGVPFSKARQSNMFNAIYHSVVTISINTSAIIDALLMGKSCISIQTDKYKDTHTGSAHFKNLLDYNAVLLVKDMAECLATIKRYLNGEDLLVAQREAFAREFVNSPEAGKSAGETIAGFLFP